MTGEEKKKTIIQKKMVFFACKPGFTSACG